MSNARAASPLASHPWDVNLLTALLDKKKNISGRGGLMSPDPGLFPRPRLIS
jgi:hypothetical protein